MKKLISVILFIVLLLAPMTAMASVESVDYYDDGSYGVVETVDNQYSLLSASTVTFPKYYIYYNSNDVKQWKVTLTATFSYTGSSAACTSATASGTVYNTAWKITKATASKSGRTATGEFTIKRYSLGIPIKTVNKKLTLTCTNSGSVS